MLVLVRSISHPERQVRTTVGKLVERGDLLSHIQCAMKRHQIDSRRQTQTSCPCRDCGQQEQRRRRAAMRRRETVTINGDEVEAELLRWRALLRSMGVRPGDRVSSFLPASVDAQLLWLASSCIGAWEVVRDLHIRNHRPCERRGDPVGSVRHHHRPNTEQLLQQQRHHCMRRCRCSTSPGVHRRSPWPMSADRWCSGRSSPVSEFWHDVRSYRCTSTHERRPTERSSTGGTAPVTTRSFTTGPGRGPALKFVDRMKDTVRRFGENISGSALEIRGIGKGARRMLQQ